MSHPRRVYDLLLDHACSEGPVAEAIIGLTWTICRGEGVGLAMSPATATGTLLSSTNGVRGV